MQTTAAALTMVRDDAFFLRAWLRHYGDQLGRENCYIVNHGRGTEVAELAQGCNIIGIPGDPHPNFDMKRWRMLNNTVQGLRCYYDHVIVGDVDELVVVDPAVAGGLLDFLRDQPLRQVLTPVGLEVLHRIDIEDQPIADHILGPRRHVRVAPHYSKPCVVSLGTKIARGGHFTQAEKLRTPEALLLFHLKFCDFGNYVDTMNRRNAVTADVGAGVKEASIGRHWFAEARGEDRAVFDAFATREMVEFDLTGVRKRMHRTWKARGETGFWQFDRRENTRQMLLPERFIGHV
ncbi:glycosyltransferase family 2 protein [Marinovum sp. 2_MG-2023]|uniref:glycosyltransferase family 2 protein n=1 Tax=unclassified Marinovum TaxID=2647166 RepID=UPI0026E3C1B5|nr:MULTISPECIES: glycosyltransferase family 2 protein [unclassified Marinovum]MDO6730482.1 glycosyltransferase family 2 protein [Marinovum sp. 2_MG-2023]MDO6778462.1 glycosyltransferase family 2 protein [Marinovum sp. 1_MG-2023]